MTDITEYERRISAALERIDRGIEATRGGLTADAAETLAQQVVSLEEALEQERAAVARLADQLAARDAELAGQEPGIDFAPVVMPSAPSADAIRVAQLEADLATERATNAQLVERVRVIREKQDQTVGALEARVARLAQTLEAGGTDAAKLRRINGSLRESNIALREALARGLADATLINRGMEVELEALRATRASDAAEIDEILSELRPMLETARA